MMMELYNRKFNTLFSRRIFSLNAVHTAAVLAACCLVAYNASIGDAHVDTKSALDASSSFSQSIGANLLNAKGNDKEELCTNKDENSNLEDILKKSKDASIEMLKKKEKNKDINAPTTAKTTKKQKSKGSKKKNVNKNKEEDEVFDDLFSKLNKKDGLHESLMGEGSESFDPKVMENLFKNIANKLPQKDQDEFEELLKSMKEENEGQKSLVDDQNYMKEIPMEKGGEQVQEEEEDFEFELLEKAVYKKKKKINDYFDVPDSLPQEFARPPKVSTEDIRKFGSFSAAAKTTQNNPQATKKGNTTANTDKLVKEDSDEVCHALVLSGGGGVKAAYQSGAILGLVERYKIQEKKLKWDVISGVSLATFVAAASLSFKPGENDEMEFARALWHFWSNLRNENVFKCEGAPLDPSNLFNWAKYTQKMVQDEQDNQNKDNQKNENQANSQQNDENLKPAVCENTPFINYIVKFFLSLKDIYEKNMLHTNMQKNENKKNEQIENLTYRKALIHASVIGVEKHQTWTVDEWTDKNKQIDESNNNNNKLHIDENLLQKILASISVPGLTLPVKLKDEQTGNMRFYSDGTVISILFAEDAIEKCIQVLEEKKKLKKKNNINESDQTLTNKEDKKGEGVIIDIIGTSPFDLKAIDPDLRKMVDSATGPQGDYIPTFASEHTSNTFESPETLLKYAKKKYPGAHFRHAIFPEKDLTVPTNKPAEKQTNTFLIKGRRSGWTAATYDDVSF